MERNSVIKTIFILMLPLFLFLLLLIPYSWLNTNVIVDWLGCGCPRINEYGEIIHPRFDANDFTRVFWSFISVCATAISSLIAIKKIPKNKKWVKIGYVVSIFVFSVLIAHHFCQMMMWK